MLKRVSTRSFSERERECYRERCNDVQVAIFDIARCTRQTKITGTLFLKEYFKHAFEFWGTVCQMTNDQNTVVLRNNNKQT